jgi:hypothetical protein
MDVFRIRSLLSWPAGLISRPATRTIPHTIEFSERSLAAIVSQPLALGFKNKKRPGRELAMNWNLLFQLVVNGIIVGALYGVVAMSFVLIYKASQVVNFRPR